MDASQWFANSVTWAANMGIFNGFDDGTFRPNENVTREQLVAVMCNYARYSGCDMSTTASLSSFSDASSVSSWAVYSMEWAYGNGIIGGKDGNVLDPQGTATRAEVAVILNRFIEYAK